jgi:hypothetical protein
VTESLGLKSDEKLFSKFALSNATVVALRLGALHQGAGQGAREVVARGHRVVQDGAAGGAAAAHRGRGRGRLHGGVRQLLGDARVLRVRGERGEETNQGVAAAVGRCTSPIQLTPI